MTQLVVGGEHDFGNGWSGEKAISTARRRKKPTRTSATSSQPAPRTQAGPGQHPAITFEIGDDGVARPIGFNTDLLRAG